MLRHCISRSAVGEGRLFFLLLLFIIPAVGQAQYTPGSWPANFIDYTDSTGSYIQDVSDQSPPETDVIFSTTTPSSVQVNSDGTHAFFRFQLSANPYNANGQWASFAWVVAIGDSTGQGSPIGWVSVSASGSSLDVTVKDQTTTDLIYSYSKKNPNPGAVRSVPAGSSGFFYLDFQVPMAALTSRIGVTASSTVRFFYGSSTSGGTINKDYMTGSAVSFIGLTSTNFTSIQTGSLIPLPVELSAFAALLKGTTAELRWETSTEVNNYGFELLRSVDGGTWSVRGFVAGAGTANTPRTYVWSESVREIPGAIRYRLRQIDRDGSQKLHGIVELQSAGLPTGGFTALYPQPAAQSVTVGYRNAGENASSLGLYDLSGRLLRYGTTGPPGASRIETINLEGMAPGSYLLRLEESGRVHSRTLLIAR